MRLFHVLNRGVDKRDIFMEEEDYVRFVSNLFEFNDKKRVKNLWYRFNKDNGKFSQVRSDKEREPRDFLVNIHAFALMPNHYHMLLSPAVEDGMSKFMQKLDGGYTRYFNEKYDRSGSLFGGRYERIEVLEDRHFLHLPYYIHCNPLDMEYPEWRDGELSDYKGALEYLANYKWSSHPDYMGDSNFASVTQRDFLLKFFGGTDGYSNSIKNWLKDLEISNFKDVTLEYES